jgi:formylglycine-generating enzyme required for sulfatase activity
MKKITIFGISLLLVAAVSVLPGRVHAASMAVLVVGLETDAASDAFAAAMRYEYTQKGYTLIDNDAVKAKLTDLRQAYKDGQTVDTVGLAAWGKENGIDFVQLAVEKSKDITISGREQVTQVVTCGTTKYTGRAYYRTRFVAPGMMPCEEEEIVGELVLGMVHVVGGVFQMGCVSGRDVCSSNSDETAHWVQVNSFYIGEYEVTQKLWKEVMGDLPDALKNDSACLGNNKPVVYVSWDDIAGSGGFLEKLNERTGKNYRLPTEAEWEYAARGCNAGVCESYQYSGSNTIGDVAWYAGNRPDSSPQPVGGKSHNGLFICDMSGNVFEWCSDWYNVYYGADSNSELSSTTELSPIINPKGPDSGSSRVNRGGSWHFVASYCRVVDRYCPPPTYRDSKNGFRLV